MRFPLSTLAPTLVAILALSACTPCPEDSAPLGDSVGTEDTTDTDTAVVDDDALTTEELDALATWTSTTASMTLFEGGPVIEGDRIAILLAGSLDDLNLDTVLTRAQDHNSSRSNKTASIAVGDGFGAGDSGGGPGLLSFAWDGRAPCAELPCASAGRPDGASSRLTIAPGTSLDDGTLEMTWGESTAMEEEFSGYLSIGGKGPGRPRHGGHVTILKAAATDDGTLVITSELTSEALTVYQDGSPVYEGKADAGALLATVMGTTGTSWPKGLSVEVSATGTLVSLTW